jgi:hypothetical protein
MEEWAKSNLEIILELFISVGVDVLHAPGARSSIAG